MQRRTTTIRTRARKTLVYGSTLAVVTAACVIAVGAPGYAQGPDSSGAIEGLSLPVGVAINSVGERFVADATVDTVSVYAPNNDATPIRTLSGMGSSAWGIAFDSDGATYVSSPGDGRVYVFNEGSTTPDRQLLDVDRYAEDTEQGEVDADGDPLTDPFAEPLGIAIDSNDNVYLANDTNGDESVSVFDAGQSTPNDAKKITGLSHPTALAINANNDVFIGSVGTGSDSVKVVPAGTNAVDPAQTKTGLTSVHGLAFGILGRLYVGTSTTVRIYNPNSNVALTSKSLVGLGQPMGIAIAKANYGNIAEGAVFVADFTHGEVARFSPGPLVEADPAAVDFTEHVVNTSTSQLITVTNPGSATLTMHNPAVSMTGMTSQFSVTGSTCNGAALLAGSGTCSFTVHFTPTSRGEKTVDVQIGSDAIDNNTYVIPVRGVGIAPVVSTSPDAKAFGSVLVAGGTGSQAFVVTNDGDAPMVFDANTVTLTGSQADQYTITSEDCQSHSVDPGNFCTITVGFDPASTGLKNANLRVEANDPESEHLYALTGTGIAPAVSLSSPSINLGQMATGFSTDPALLTVTNSGSAPLIFEEIALSLSGDDSASFEITSDGCSSQSLDPTESCQVGVRFNSSTLGPKAAALAVASNAPGTPHAVSLAGMGVPPSPTVSTNVPSKNFGQLIIGTTPAKSASFVIENTGTSTLTIGQSNVAISGANAADYSITANTCSGTDIAIGNSCGITVRFLPSTIGLKVASLNITSNAPTVVDSIALSGAGISPPSPPPVVAAVSGNRNARVTWTLPANGNSAITGFVVQRSTRAAGPFVSAPGCTTAATTASSRSCTATGLTNGTVYYFRVAAINTAGTGAFRVSAAVTPRALVQSPVKCGVLPTNVKRTGRTVVVPGICKTNAGQVVKVTAKRTGAVQVARSGNKWTVVTNGRAGTATITLSAPAIGSYVAFVRTRTYRI